MKIFISKKNELQEAKNKMTLILQDGLNHFKVHFGEKPLSLQNLCLQPQHHAYVQYCKTKQLSARLNRLKQSSEERKQLHAQQAEANMLSALSPILQTADK